MKTKVPLAERDLPGFPGASIALFHSPKGDKATVLIVDADGETKWENLDRSEAASRYFHPFCYGYEYDTN